MGGNPDHACDRRCLKYNDLLDRATPRKRMAGFRFSVLFVKVLEDRWLPFRTKRGLQYLAALRGSRVQTSSAPSALVNRTENLAAASMNGGFSRRAAALKIMQLQQFSCCERLQRKFDGSVVGSNLAFNASVAKACFG